MNYINSFNSWNPLINSFTTLLSKEFADVNPKNLLKRHIYTISWPRHTFTNLDTHKERKQWKKTQTFVKSMGIGIWVIGTLNQLFTRVSYTQIEFWKQWITLVRKHDWFWQVRYVLPSLFVLTSAFGRALL